MVRGSKISRSEQWAMKRLKEMKTLPAFLKTPEIRAQIARDEAALAPAFSRKAAAAVSQAAHTLVQNGYSKRDAYCLARREVAEAKPVQSSAASKPKAAGAAKVGAVAPASKAKASTVAKVRAVAPASKPKASTVARVVAASPSASAPKPKAAGRVLPPRPAK